MNPASSDRSVGPEPAIKVADTRSIWLLMLREGGRWTTAEISRAFNADPQKVSKLLKSMTVNGSVVRYEPSAGQPRMRYGVRPHCRIPQSITLGQVLEVKAK